MKHFFYTVFGGIFAITTGIGVAYGGAWAWNQGMPYLASVVTSALAADDGETLVDGLRRTVRFSAHEEEDDSTISSVALHAPDESITARGYIVMDLSTNTIVSEKNSNTLMPIASVTKLVTAIVARRHMSGNQRITMTDRIIATYGNTAGFEKGETMLADDLLYPLLMVSSNDAAEAFAGEYGRKNFLREMNSVAQEIGAYRTYFADPSGLSPSNVSTPSDLALIIDWIRKNDPRIIELTSLKSKTVRAHTWTNPTHFLSWSQYIGGKNGYIPEAGRTAVSLFDMGPDRKIYAIVVLGSASRDTDMLKLIGKIDE
ncbi:MAG: serine hydrolase [Patescibacteria group bacterium]